MYTHTHKHTYASVYPTMLLDSNWHLKCNNVKMIPTSKSALHFSKWQLQPSSGWGQNSGHLSFSQFTSAAAAAKSLQLCPTLCDPIDGSPAGSPDPGILQARTLEWVAISFSNAWKWKGKVKSLSRVRLFSTPWTAAYQAPVHGIFQARVLEWVAIAFSEFTSKPSQNMCLH